MTATATSVGERRRDEFIQAWRDAVQVPRHEEQAQPPILHRVKPIVPWPRAYTLTTLEPDARIGSRSRTVMLGDFATCRDTVERNDCDIFETTYLLAVIEEVYPSHNYGGFGGRQTYWFAWRGEYRTGGYVPIAPPVLFANVSGFGVG